MLVNTPKIKSELKRLGWNQSTFAKKMGMTRAGISFILVRRTAPLRTLTKMGRVLQLDPRDLLI